jgi:hypothetical protein
MGGQHHVAAAIYPGRDLVPIVQEVGWSSGGPEYHPAFCMSPETLASTGVRNRTVHSLASHYAEHAIAAAHLF